MNKRKRYRKGQLNRIGRRRRNLRIGLAIIAAALIGIAFYQLNNAGMVPANETAEEWYEANRRPVELVNLPADDGPHDNYTEWWYYNGHLQAQDGKRFSFHYVIFVINRLAGHTVAHASLVDHQTGRHYTTQQRTAGKPNEHDGRRLRFQLRQLADGRQQRHRPDRRRHARLQSQPGAGKRQPAGAARQDRSARLQAGRHPATTTHARACA